MSSQQKDDRRHPGFRQESAGSLRLQRAARRRTSNITDETRINAALPTIKYLLDHNAAVILCSHLGRPKGEFNMKYSLAPVAKRLSEKLGFEVKLAKDVVGPDAKKLAAEVKPGEAVLLENVRFHARRGKERSRVRQGAGFHGGNLRLRRLRHRASRACFHRGRGRVSARRCRLPDRQGAELPGQRRGTIPSVPSWPSSAAPRSRTRSASSTTCWTRSTPCSSAAACPTPSARPRGGEIGDSLLDEERLGLALELMDKAKAKGVKMLLPVDNVCGDSSLQRHASSMTCAVRQDPGWLRRHGHRPEDRRSCSPRRSRRPRRSSGTARWACSRCPNFAKGTLAIAAGHGRFRRHHHHRRRRQRGGCDPDGPG